MPALIKNKTWSAALKACADPQRARQQFGHLAVTRAAAIMEKASAGQARVLAALLAGSNASSNLLIANPDWLDALDPERLRHPRSAQGLRREVNGWLPPALDARDYPGALARLRQFKQREQLRNAARDLARLGHVTEITRDLSDVADVCLGAVLQICRRQLTERFGRPYHQDADGRWQPTGFCVIGLGKLGGQELNYSSDVDVVFLYDEEGQVFKAPPAVKEKPAPSAMSNHQFFDRLAKAVIEAVAGTTSDGSLYRMDLRLRPEGDAGPLARSLAGYENYYAQWGQTWERMMLIKARCVAGDEALAAEFLEMIQSFRYPRSLGEGIMREIATTKERIENEVVKADELERNVKLGRGGIREIEFSVQTLQIIHAGRQPFLQDPQTLSALAKLAKYDLLSRDDARALAEAYCFLRDVEHRLQMEDNLQTHTLPTNAPALDRLAGLMGFASAREFEAVRRKHTGNVRRIYDALLRAEATEPRPVFPDAFAGAETEWKNLLAGHGFKDAEKSFRLLGEFVEGPDYVHVSPRTRELARTLLSRFLALCPSPTALAQIASRPVPVLSDPDRVLTRLDSFIAVYGARATLFEMWSSNPLLFELLLRLFDRSEFLAETAIRTPDLLDDLVLSDRLRRSKSAGEILSELRLGRADADQRLWLRRYHQAEFMRIGLRDILELTDTEQIFSELSALADACLQYALEVALRKNKIRTPPLVVIGLGKLGGTELTYGSDLDIVFVADDHAKNLPALKPVAVEMMALLSAPTELGVAFHTDARLRPDGEKGLLVNTLAAYEEYYRRRAQLWEIQALTRTRPIAGDLKLGERYQQLVAQLVDFKQPGRPLTAFTPDWKGQIHKMRLRIEKERTPAGQDDLAIKTGRGGLMDAEFIAQALCLENGWLEANTLRALERARTTKALAAADADQLIENYCQLRRLERILRRWSFEGETVLPDEDAPYYRVSVRCGFPTPDAFRTALAKWRQAIREVYAGFFQP